MTELRRHALVWLREPPHPEFTRDVPEVARWHARGYPFVVCCQRGQSDRLSLGFCLPSNDGEGLKPVRLAVQSHSSQILRMSLPPLLADVAARVSAIEKNEILLRIANAAASSGLRGLTIHVFGSWMWRALTDDQYVKASSDLDLLVAVNTEEEADQAVAFLEREAANCPLRIDGELSFSDRGEVHWREYLGEMPLLLLKSISDVRMIRREDLWK